MERAVYFHSIACRVLFGFFRQNAVGAFHFSNAVKFKRRYSKCLCSIQRTDDCSIFLMLKSSGWQLQGQEWIECFAQFFARNFKLYYLISAFRGISFCGNRSDKGFMVPASYFMAIPHARGRAAITFSRCRLIISLV
ncbi:MAG TPA: hypothetical protein PKM63_11830 [Panacibacter sp.]|nr:hypothetical protein [Panacibacter sp.]HNP44969.1 hypothetical protein [Panacibacter sp.]